MEVIPEGAHELELDAPKGEDTHLFLVDHLDHVLSRRDAEHWKREIAQVTLPKRAILIIACRSEIAERWPSPS
jgi:hypothetical protein